MKHERKIASAVHRRGEPAPMFVAAADRPVPVTPMATPTSAIQHPEPIVVVVRPAWLDTPLFRIVPRLLALMLIFAPGVAFWALITRLIWRAF